MQRAVLLAAACALAGRAGCWPAPRAGSTCAESLPHQSICEDSDGLVSVFFQGEFGTELVVALPAVFAAWRQDKLRETRGCGGDMRALYYFSPNQCVVYARCVMPHRLTRHARTHRAQHGRARLRAALLR
jgi:hypothetical protein